MFVLSAIMLTIPALRYQPNCMKCSFREADCQSACKSISLFYGLNGGEREGNWRRAGKVFYENYGFRELRIDYGLFLNKGSCIVAASYVRRWFVIGTGIVIVDVIFTWLDGIKNKTLINFIYSSD